MKRTGRLLILPLLLVFLTGSVHAAESCHEAIQSHFTLRNPHVARELFQLQARLTLHRLAWAHLTRVSESKAKDSKAQLPKVEDSIRAILKEFEAKRKDSAFQTAEETFLKAPLSRRAFAEVMDSLKDTLKAQATLGGDFPLHLEDIKLLSVLAESEDSITPRNTLYVKPHTDPRSMLNLLKIINSSYSGRTTGEAKTEAAFVKKEIDRLESQLSTYAAEVQRILRDNPACKDERPCENCEAGAAASKSESESITLLLELLRDELKKNDYAGVRYGDVWLRTRKASRPLAIRSEKTESRPEKKTDDPPKSPASVQPEKKPPPAAIPPIPELVLSGKVNATWKGQVDEVNAAYRTLAQLGPCIQRHFPALAKSSGAYLRAAGSLSSELQFHATLGGPIENLRKYNSRDFSSNPFASKKKSCPELDALSTRDQLRGVQLLGAFDFWAAGGKENQHLSGCKNLMTEEKLMVRALFGLRILEPESFQGCKIPEEVERGMKVYREFFRNSQLKNR